MANTSNNNLIGINFGRFLPLNVINELYKIYDNLQELTDRILLENITADNIEKINRSFDDIEVNYLDGGKDTIFLVRAIVEDYKFIFKFYNLKSYEIFVYLLSLHHFSELIPDIITLEEQGKIATVHVVPLHVYAVGKITTQLKSSYVIIQEYSENQDYTDFIKDYQIPFNIVKKVWKYIHKNGFVIDFLPSNFKISFNQENQLYWLEYLDYLFFNDPKIRTEAIMIDQQIQNEFTGHELFTVLERDNGH